MAQLPLRTLIVDDERIARQILREELATLPEVVVVGEAADGIQALQQIADLLPDLVFLDVQMPGMGGFDVVRNLIGKHLPAVVMVTAFDQYAIQAFEAGAVDYLLKPVRDGRLRQAIQRVQSLMGKPPELAQDLARIASAAAAPARLALRKIVGRVGREYFLLDSDEVLAFQAERELVWIITANRRLLATQTLRELEIGLPPSAFLRVRRGAIVNVNPVRKVSALSDHRWLVTLSADTIGTDLEFSVSKRLAQSVRRILKW
jgi:DNA-binding LytR/AlgR family response regulator